MEEYEVTLSIPHIEALSIEEAIMKFKALVNSEGWIFTVTNMRSGNSIVVDTELFEEDETL